MQNRRQAIAAVAATVTTLAGCAAPTASGLVTKAANRPTIKPPPLRAGDTIGLVATSGVLNPTGVAQRVSNLEGMGFKVRLSKHLLARWGGYAGTVEQRLDDLHAMFCDGDVRAVWAARGGSGLSALLPHIDYSLLAKNPKIVVGYSDVTALHMALYSQIGLVSFHGPTAGSTFSEFNVRNLRAALMGESRGYAMGHAPENLARAVTESAFKPRTHVAGRAVGRLLGGNLSVLAALVGTPYLTPLGGHLLFLEEIDEAPYRVDRLMHQLQQSNARGQRALGELGGSSGCAGVMVGVFSKCEARPGDQSLTLQEVLSEHLDSLGVPAVSGYGVGHIAHQMTLPIGITAELDTAKQQLTLLESATDAS